MTKQLSTGTVVCSNYQKLLEESAAAREAWRKLRDEICWAQLVGKESGDELLRLQAKYAKAYALLQNHMNVCGRCRLVSKIA